MLCYNALEYAKITKMNDYKKIVRDDIEEV